LIVAKTPVLVSWSGGKDSALALAAMLEDNRYSVISLLTTIAEEEGSVAMHGVDRALIRAQADALGLPLHEVSLPAFPSNEIYEQRMGAAYARFRERGVKHVVFGDLFLSDIRAYRENLHRSMGMRCLFPLWGEDTAQLAARFLADGYSAVICCVDPKQGDGAWAGRMLDPDFFARLSGDIDPCGENGEFHTLVTGGPIFEHAIPVKVSGTYEDKGFVYAAIELDASC
jgi:uncharacterized protein (TIGR00290 family)